MKPMAPADDAARRRQEDAGNAQLQREIDAQRPVINASYLRKLLSGHVASQDEFQYMMESLGLDGRTSTIMCCSASRIGRILRLPIRRRSTTPSRKRWNGTCPARIRCITTRRWRAEFVVLVNIRQQTTRIPSRHSSSTWFSCTADWRMPGCGSTRAWAAAARSRLGCGKATSRRAPPPVTPPSTISSSPTDSHPQRHAGAGTTPSRFRRSCCTLSPPATRIRRRTCSPSSTARTSRSAACPPAAAEHAAF